MLFWKDMLSMLMALAGTIFVIFLTYYCSRWYARKMGTPAGSRHMRVIDRLGISKTGSILIIEVEGRQYLIGASEGGINVMKELPENITLASGKEDAGGQCWKSFRNLLYSKQKQENRRTQSGEEHTVDRRGEQ